MCHLRSVAAGNIALSACSCGPHNHEITITVGKRWKLTSFQHDDNVERETWMKVKHHILWHDYEFFPDAHGQLCASKRWVVVERYGHGVLWGCSQEEKTRCLWQTQLGLFCISDFFIISKRLAHLVLRVQVDFLGLLGAGDIWWGKSPCSSASCWFKVTPVAGNETE